MDMVEHEMGESTGFLFGIRKMATKKSILFGQQERHRQYERSFISLRFEYSPCLPHKFYP
jgi:hypothetical protein